MKSNILLTCLASLMTVAILSGCGGGDDRVYGKLEGIVTLNGTAAPEGTIINMINLENGAATSAPIRAEGAYSIPRVQVGTYNVGFAPAGAAAAAEGPQDPDAMMQQIEKGTYEAPDASTKIPDEFRNPESSGQTVNVVEGENTHDFNL